MKFVVLLLWVFNTEGGLVGHTQAEPTFETIAECREYVEAFTDFYGETVDWKTHRGFLIELEDGSSIAGQCGRLR